MDHYIEAVDLLKYGEPTCCDIDLGEADQTALLLAALTHAVGTRRRRRAHAAVVARRGGVSRLRCTRCHRHPAAGADFWRPDECHDCREERLAENLQRVDESPGGTP